MAVPPALGGLREGFGEALSHTPGAVVFVMPEPFASALWLPSLEQARSGRTAVGVQQGSVPAGPRGASAGHPAATRLSPPRLCLCATDPTAVPPPSWGGTAAPNVVRLAVAGLSRRCGYRRVLLPSGCAGAPLGFEAGSV